MEWLFFISISSSLSLREEDVELKKPRVIGRTARLGEGETLKPKRERRTKIEGAYAGPSDNLPRHFSPLPVKLKKA